MQIKHKHSIAESCILRRYTYGLENCQQPIIGIHQACNFLTVRDEDDIQIFPRMI